MLKVAEEIIGSLDVINYTIGREGSPVIYLSLNILDTENRLGLLCNKLKKLNENKYIADEILLDGNELRLWYD